MVGRIHLHERIDKMRAAAGDFAHAPIARLAGQRGGTVTIVEEVILPAD
jgi:hypothetical protein